MAPEENDIILRGGTVVDGTGRLPFEADVRVRAGRIVEVGPSLTPEGEEQLDALYVRLK
jgi:N-acyl-D-amino-acid deacylase